MSSSLISSASTIVGIYSIGNINKVYELDNINCFYDLNNTDIIIYNKIIGRGGQGVVLLGRYKNTDVAIKVINYNILNPYINNDVRKELEVIKELKHPNLLKIYGAIKVNYIISITIG